MLKSLSRHSLESIRSEQFFIFKSKALFGSKLMATKNKPISQIFFKRSLIPILSSNLTYLAP